MPNASSFARLKLHRMGPQRQAGGAIVGHHFVGRLQRAAAARPARRRLGNSSNSGRLATACSSARACHKRRAAIELQRRKGVGRGQPRHHRPAQPRAAHEIFPADKRPPRPRACSIVRACTSDSPRTIAQAQPQRAAFQRAIPVAGVHVDRAHLDAVLAGVAHQLGRRIKTHRLAVEQRRGERGRIVMLQPGRDVDQQREAGGVRFGKAVFAEAADLPKHRFGEFAATARWPACRRSASGGTAR